MQSLGFLTQSKYNIIHDLDLVSLRYMQLLWYLTQSKLNHSGILFHECASHEYASHNLTKIL